MRSIGLDVLKRFAEVAIIEGKGPPDRRRIGTTPAALRAFATTLRPDDQLVLEATMNTWAIADVLRTSGARSSSRTQCARAPSPRPRVKTDKVDAETLAQLLAADFVPEVWVKGKPSLALRREQELAMLDEAEAASKAAIAQRRAKDAAAANGEATVRPSKGARCAAELSSPALRSSHGVDRVRGRRIRLRGLTVSSV